MTNSKQKQSADSERWRPLGRTWFVVMLQCLSFAIALPAQTVTPNGLEQEADKQINVNWLHRSYVPKEVPLESLNHRIGEFAPEVMRVLHRK
jgi:hypothetical protein